MLARDAVTPCDVVIGSETSLEEAHAFYVKHDVSALPIVDQEHKVIGLLNSESFAQALSLPDWKKAKVREVMQENFITVAEEAELEEIWNWPVEWFVVLSSSSSIKGVLAKQDLASLLYKKVQQRLQQLEGVLDSAHNGIIAIDKNGIVTFFNKAAEEIVWRKKKDAIGKHLSQVIIPQGLLEILKTGKRQLCHKFAVEYSAGTRIYMTHRTPIFEDGKVVGAVGVFQDISEIEAISNELDTVKRLNRELEAVIGASYDGIMVTDRNGVVVRVNEAFERMTGYKSTEIIGRTLMETGEEQFLPGSIVEKIKASKQPVSIAVDHGGRQFLFTGNPVTDQEGEIVRIVINVRDLTELNSLRKELKESKELSRRYHSELYELRRKLLQHEGIVVQSPQMQKILELAMRVATVDSTVLILGESGVGKEVIAKLIHQNSKRSEGPFITVNCGAIPETLLESELFGYEPGAFTGASREGKLGLFELADNGTLFLDEIGDLPFPLQVKLLRAIQDREIIRLGGRRPRKVNVRIVAATNRDLEEMVKNGQFREDLYFRLNVVPLKIPPLRERKEEIIPLVNRFLEKYCKNYNIKKTISSEVLDRFLKYDWPGNIRELENIIERLVVTASGTTITPADLPEHLKPQCSDTSPAVLVKGILPLKNAVMEVERQLIEKALEQYGSTYKAAKALRVNQSTVVRKLNRIRREANGGG
ncbi:sigma-54-dependent Fis family transcriptional regulator [Calderihabitans maritimus]|uniref:sigma-54-dependent Fis family transcriptional regulator n=1 Tax=Calderihabitans maritimus TaxID=1246530 RepID=UPI001863DA40|nr:sigma-54-dependent Fis family transcriptional regulator [Calderihabitans maritimus]